jgi:hypothetical protein
VVELRERLGALAGHPTPRCPQRALGRIEAIQLRSETTVLDENASGEDGR